MLPKMNNPIVVSKYFNSSTKTTPIKKEEREPILERDLSQHTDTEINEQLSVWTVNTQTEEDIPTPNDLDLTIPFSEKNDQEETAAIEIDQYNKFSVELIDDTDLDQLNISEGKDEMTDGMKKEIEKEEEEEVTEEEEGDNENEIIKEEKENTPPRCLLDLNQFRVSSAVKKETIHSLDSNQVEASIKVEGKIDLHQFKAPTEVKEERQTTNIKLDLNQFRAPTVIGPIDLNQFNAPLDPRYKSRIPPKTSKPRKQVPSFKYMKDTRFVVDAFSHGKIADCDGYFLTHFHTDHYGGLKSSWTHGPIYCSQITANLVKAQLKVDEQYIHPLPMDTLVSVTDDISVGLIDANHCPGSVLFLFVIYNKEKGTTIRHLHTGDFRASPRMCMHPLIRQPDNPPLNSVYLDTTYMDPKYAFPAQEECIDAVCALVQKELVNSSRSITSFMDKWTSNKRPKTMNERVLIVVGAYKIGKERVFHNVAKMIESKIYVTDDRKQILDCQENKDLTDRLTKDPLEAQVHVVQLNTIKGDNMCEYLKNHTSAFDRMIAIKPTGWAYKSSSQPGSIVTMTSLSEVIIPPKKRSLPLLPSYNWSNVKVYGVPYSEHSSFRELASFIASLEMEQIIPTVKTPDDMVSLLDQWQKEKVVGKIVDYTHEDHW